MPRKSKTTKRPRRTSRRKKGARVTKIVILTSGFIVLIFLGLYAINYLKQNASSNYTGKTLSATEMDNLIKDVDNSLTAAFFEAGISANNIESKKVYNKEENNLVWEYKDIQVSPAKGVTAKKVKKVLQSSIIEEYPVDYKFDNGKDLLVAYIRINDINTHKIRFEFEKQKAAQSKKKDSTKTAKTPDKKKTSSNKNILKKEDSTKKQADINKYPKSKIVIIVDDLGLNKQPIDALLKLNAPITFAVLPNLPYSSYAAEKADKKGWDVILHMPMEPKESSGYTGTDAGEDALLVGLPKDVILNKMNSNLSSVPHVVGVNNHMGSKFMENDELMELILTDLKKKDMMFIDSKTTAQSKGYVTARRLGMKTAQRDMFLDHSAKDAGHVKQQLQKLVDLSKKKGYAVGICHPYPGTIEALSQMIPKITQEVEVVSISNIINSTNTVGRN
ncbi:MAG: divergent polysaccharide deacetylase family protein [Thermodesulfobacteriota bacterium]